MECKDKKTDELICLEATATKLDGFSLDDLNDDDFNPRAFGANTSAAPEEDSDDTNDENDFNPRADLPPPATKAPAVILAPPPALPPREAPPIPTPSNNTKIDVFSSDDPFASNPFTGSQDPFGMSAFDSGAKSKNPLDAFQAGLGIGNFSLDELDPLKKWNESCERNMYISTIESAPVSFVNMIIRKKNEEKQRLYCAYEFL